MRKEDKVSSRVENKVVGKKCVNCIHYNIRKDMQPRQGECRLYPPKPVGGLVMAPIKNKAGLVTGESVPQVMQQSMFPVIHFDLLCSQYDSKLNYDESAWYDDYIEYQEPKEGIETP